MSNLNYDTYFQDLAKQDPDKVCKRALCGYNDAQKSFQLSMWGQEYVLFPKLSKIDRIGKNTLDPENYHFLFIIWYLLNAKEVPLSHQWISEKDMPGGPTFFRGPHEIPTRLIVNRYGNDLERFQKDCQALKGIPLDFGDAAFWFEITPRIPVAVVYWTGDEDFPAEAKILYDQTITQHLTLDIIFVLAVLVCNRVGRP